MPLNFASLERIVPSVLDSDGATGQATLNLHLARYEFAARHLRAGSLLDAACGVGYGTKLLTSTAGGITSTIGIDISDAAVEYARTHYPDPRARFISTDVLAFSHTPG